MRLEIRFSILLVISLFGTVNPLWAVRATAQTSGRVQVQLSRQVSLSFMNASLGEVLHYLTSEYGLRIVADGAPLTPVTSITYSGALKDTLDKLAEKFDFSWRIGKASAILLEKRFTHPDDIPQLYPAELREVARDILTILPKIEPDPNHVLWGQVLIELSRTFVPEQVQALRNGARLSVSDLPAAQQSLVQKAILLRGFGVARAAWEALSFQMDNLQDSVIQPLGMTPPKGEAAARSVTVAHVATDKHRNTYSSPLGTITKGPKQ